MSSSNQFTPSQKSSNVTKTIFTAVLVIVFLVICVCVILLLVGPQIANIFSKVTNGLSSTYN